MYQIPNISCRQKQSTHVRVKKSPQKQFELTWLSPANRCRKWHLGKRRSSKRLLSMSNKLNKVPPIVGRQWILTLSALVDASIRPCSPTSVTFCTWVSQRNFARMFYVPKHIPLQKFQVNWTWVLSYVVLLPTICIGYGYAMAKILFDLHFCSSKIISSCSFCK